MLKSIHDLKKKFFYGPLIEKTCFCTVIYASAANSSRLPCVDSADFVQEPEDTTVPSTRATSGQSDGIQKEARHGGSGCHVSKVTSITYSGQAELGERPCVCCKSFNNVRKPSKKKLVQQNVKGEMADTYCYISGDLLCALLPLFVDGILRNTNQKKFSKWRHQTIYANFLVLTRPKRLLFSNKRKRVNIGQNVFTLNQGDTPLDVSVSFFLTTKVSNKALDKAYSLCLKVLTLQCCQGIPQSRKIKGLAKCIISCYNFLIRA